MENFQLTQIIREAAPLLIDGQVGRVFEPKAQDFALTLRGVENICLYVSVLPARPAIFLTERSFRSLENDRAVGHFTNLMRKYLTGATVVSVTKEPDERRVRIDFTSFDAAGQRLLLNLLIELTGRSANAHLFIDGAYLASLRDLPDATLALSLSPLPPAPNSIVADTLDGEIWQNLVQQSSLGEVAKQLRGFSPILVRELVARAQQSDPYQALQSLLSDLRSTSLPASIYAPFTLNRQLERLPIGQLDARANLLLSFFPLVIAQGLKATEFATFNQAADYYYELLTRREIFQTRRNALLGKLRAEATKLTQLLNKLTQEAAEFARADEYRRWGDLILANLATAQRDGQELVMIDFFDPAQFEIRVKIEENQSPQQLAEDYFKRYQRARRGAQATAKRIGQVEKELAYKQQLIANCQAVESEVALDQAEAPFAPPKAPGQRDGKERREGKDKSDGVSVRRYLSSDGFEILVGRSDASNDQITFRIAKPADIWLHTADYPGPHVLIRNPARKAIPHKTIFEAAQLAAFFSKARGETSAAVRYTEKKHVTRPKKAKPGMALLTQFKTLNVPPQEAGQRIL